MKQKEVFKKIGGIIEELSDQYEYLKTVTDDLNDLELELFVANAHFLTDHIEVLCKLNLQSRAEKRAPEKAEKVEKPEKAVKQETAHEQKYFEPVVQQMKHASEKADEKTSKDTSKPKPVELEIANGEKPQDQPAPEIDVEPGSDADSYSFIREEPETIRHELVLDESMDLDEDEQTEIESEPVKEPRKRKQTNDAPVEETIPEIADAGFAAASKEAEAPAAIKEEDILTINQKISSQLGDKGLARTEQLGIKPISDIKLAITLNDKLLYVKDLFNGYNLAYSEAIEILNRFNTFEEAQRFLKTNYVIKNNWESKPATTEKFYALLKRRYA